jgi:hypothetical protein
MAPASISPRSLVQARWYFATHFKADIVVAQYDVV